ncbi:hypothetical protein DDZ18_03015 [Marinicauda salina]|uniref:Type II secretion system protein GspF domain-containing protein n=1 Tax=Marinicauda salina TaxID=2135793 RepID=A0A2U2BX89_9PROT|nr:type II secretion system F family protein [Marinicauda salina]PWE18589.1 hypothetical protein DDZ18_03015 [Marinicauda salina]
MAELFTPETLILATVFAAVVAAIVGVWGMLRRNTAAERMSEAISAGDIEVGDTIVDRGRLPRALRAMEPLQRRLTQSDPTQVGEVRRALIEAGLYDRRAVDIFFSSRLILGVLFGVGAASALFLLPTPLTGLYSLVAVLSATALGYYAPVLWLRLRISGRREAFRNGLPDALDMILVGVQAGLSLSAALRHVVDELSEAHPVVAEQFQGVALEFQAGMSRTEALSRMADRMQVQEARTFATMISQSEQLGTSLADTLHVIAEEMRISRMLKAEKTAAELPVKMALPLVLLIFPCLFIVILSPVMIMIIETFRDLAG